MAKQSVYIANGATSVNTSYSSESTWQTANNVRFRLGAPEVIGGWQAMSPSTLNGTCRNILPWKDNLGADMVAFGTNSNLYVWRNGTQVNITPTEQFTVGNANGTVAPGYGVGSYGAGPYGEYIATSTYAAATWSLSNFGQSLIASPRGGHIYWWQNNLAGTAALLSDSVANGVTNYIPAQNNYVMVTQQRSVMSFGCNQQLDSNGNAPGPYNPLCIRVSSNDGLITDWGVTATNTADEITLPNGGSIVAARQWASLIAVWTEDGLYQGSYTGDTDQQYSFEAVAGGVGLLGPNAAVCIGQTIYWVSPNLQIWGCTSGGEPFLLTCPILDDTLSNCAPGQGDKVVVSWNVAANELRIDYPDFRDGVENSRYLCLYLQDNVSWSSGQMARTAFDRGAPLEWPVGVAPPNASGQSTYYYHEIGNSADGGVISWDLQSNDFRLDDDETYMMIRGFWPDFKDQQGNVNLTLYVRDAPQSEEYACGPLTITPGLDRVDFRQTGKLFRIGYSGSSAPAFVRIGAPVFDVIPAGTRN